MQFFRFPHDDRGCRQYNGREVKAQRWYVSGQREEFENEAAIGHSEENGACEGCVEERGVCRVFWRVARVISPGQIRYVLLCRVDLNGLGSWEEGGDMGRDEDTGLHQTPREKTGTRSAHAGEDPGR